MNVPLKALIVMMLMSALQISNTSAQESGDDVLLPKNAILLTPLMGVIGDQKSSIYYKRLIKYSDDHYSAIRIGTELMTTYSYSSSSDQEEQMKSINLKAGLEYGKKWDKSILYWGGELSFTRYSSNTSIMIPLQNALFNTETIITGQEFSEVEKSTLDVYALIGFVGFKYRASKHIFIGIESGVGVGRYNSDLTFENPAFSLSNLPITGYLSQVVPSRFLFIEFQF